MNIVVIVDVECFVRVFLFPSLRLFSLFSSSTHTYSYTMQ